MKIQKAYILDCDGVIFDSNQMKISAVEAVLLNYKKYSDSSIGSCIENFKNNFGKSRYWHVKEFIKILTIPLNKKSLFQNAFLKDYSEIVSKNYKNVNLCEGVEEFLKKNTLDKYIVSGSDEDELKEIFKYRNLDKYFKQIYGSPKTKIDNISEILSNNLNLQFTMIGDAYSDYIAAKENGIKFIYYKKYSVDHKIVNNLIKDKNIHELTCWRDLNG